MKKIAQRTAPFAAWLLATTALAGLAAGDAAAAGFAIKEQSATAQGNSFAGATAGAEDISYMFFNPAGLALHDGNQAAAVLSYIVVKSEFRSASATDMVGAAVDGTSTGDAGGSAIVPAVYGMWSITPDLKLGLGINAPFGLVTEYDPNWVGRYHAIKTELITININPAVAYRINEMVSIGAGLQIQHSEATFSQAIDFNSISGGGVPADGSVTVEGDAWGYGFNLGAMIEFSPATRIGVAYRSEISTELEGTGDFTIPFGVLPAAFGGVFADTAATADYTSPATASIGLYHDLSDSLAIMGEVAWTGWSSFDELRIDFANVVQPDSVTIENWDDSWFYAIGATWKPTGQLGVRIGLAYDQSPIPDSYRTPRIPGADRTWVSVGINYTATPGFSIDVGYTHVFVDNSTLDLSPGVPVPTSLQLNAVYENSVDIIAVQGTFRF